MRSEPRVVEMISGLSMVYLRPSQSPCQTQRGLGRTTQRQGFFLEVSVWVWRAHSLSSASISTFKPLPAEASVTGSRRSGPRLSGKPPASELLEGVLFAPLSAGCGSTATVDATCRETARIPSIDLVRAKQTGRVVWVTSESCKRFPRGTRVDASVLCLRVQRLETNIPQGFLRKT